MEDNVKEVVTAPAALIRITSVVRQVLQEMRTGPLDNAARVRVVLLLRACLAELDQCLGPALYGELRRLVRVDTNGCTDKSLQVAMATLLGWLEGLMEGIRMSLTAQGIAVARNAYEHNGPEQNTSLFNSLRHGTGKRSASLGGGQYL